MPGLPVATEPVYRQDANGVRRLVAAAGDSVPTGTPTFGIVTPADAPNLRPWDGYDLLAEDAILALLDGMPADELEQVQAYEKEHMARGSIMRYGLRSDVFTATPEGPLNVPSESLSEGYDGMSSAALQAEAALRGLAVRGTGANGNVLKRDLVAALQDSDAVPAAQ